MRTVLAIMGSPRRGDSHGLAQRVEEQMALLGSYEFEYLWLRDAHIQFCRGCYRCFTEGEEHCPLEDDVPRIEAKLLHSDGVIFASPVYAMGMTALLKNLLDRLAYTMHRPRFFDQKTLIVVTAGAAGIRQTIAGISAVGSCGFDIIDSFGFVLPPGRQTQAEQRRFAHRSGEAAGRLHQAIQRGGYSAPTLQQLAVFRIQQQIYGLLREHLPADYEYFAEQGWLDPRRRFYVEAPVSPIKDLVARVAARIARRQIQARERAVQRERDLTSEG
ncbi:MAG: flavodoxin family protein [Armatimonadota bacterium]